PRREVGDAGGAVTDGGEHRPDRQAYVRLRRPRSLVPKPRPVGRARGGELHPAGGPGTIPGPPPADSRRGPTGWRPWGGAGVHPGCIGRHRRPRIRLPGSHLELPARPTSRPARGVPNPGVLLPAIRVILGTVLAPRPEASR